MDGSMPAQSLLVPAWCERYMARTRRRSKGPASNRVEPISAHETRHRQGVEPQTQQSERSVRRADMSTRGGPLSSHRRNGREDRAWSYPLNVVLICRESV